MEKRVWRVSSGQGTHAIELTFSRWTGRGVLTVDGRAPASFDPLAALGPAADHHFRIGDRDAILQPATDGLSFGYDLLVDGRSVETGLPNPLARRLRSRNWLAGIQIFVVLAVVVVASASWLALVELRYERSAQIAPGTIVSKQEEERGTESTYTEYNVRYQFSVPDGRVVEAEAEVDRPTYTQLEVGSPVSIQYLPEDTTSSRLNGQSGWVYAQWLAVAAAAVGATSSLFLAVRMSKERTERRLVESGLLASAVITAIDKVRLPEAHRAVRYSYRDHEGRERHGRSWTLRQDEVAGWNVGDPCRIRYDERHPGVSLFVERLPR